MLAAQAFGIPAVSLSFDHGVLGDLGACTADFRDQFYGLVPFVRVTPSGAVGPDEAPLVTTGLIESAECRWGRTPTRFAKQRYAAPVVAHAAARYLGTGLTARSVKLSAKQLAALPLPGDREAWDRGAELARAAQEGTSSVEGARLLMSCAEKMCAAYDVDPGETLEWWAERTRRR